MLPNVDDAATEKPGSARGRVSARRVRGSSALVRLLDEHLFTPRGWFLLDAENSRIRSVASLREGQEAVLRGEAASVAGLVRPEIVVLDVDVEDGPAHSGSAITEQVVSWCLARGLWHVVRPSGGAEGRFHVFVAPGAQREALELLVPELRRTHGVAGSAIDLRSDRRAVRPLSAPHRHGGCPKPLGDPHKALVALMDLLPDSPVPLRIPKGARARVASAVTATLVPEVSVRRVRREIDLGWRDYFEQGTPPVPDSDRSTLELMATTSLVRAGLPVDEAWETVLAAHPEAMTKTRARGRNWWVKNQWNRAVSTDNAWMNEHSPFVDRSPSVATAEAQDARTAVEAARYALRVLQWRVSDRGRAGWLHVAHTLLDRMQRTGQLVVPCPERDLLVDTGLDRATIRRHLHAAAEVGLWEVVDAFDPKHRATSSNLVRLNPQFEPGGSLSVLPPPVVHTPQGIEGGHPWRATASSPAANPTPSGPWGALLPSPAYSLLRTLPGLVGAASTAAAGQAAGMTYGPLAAPTVRQLRTIEEHLHTLAAVGLAGRDSDGGWYRVEEPSAHLRAAAEACRAQRLEEVTREREEYREAGGHARWARQRDAARARDIRRGRARFAALPRGLRDARRVACRQRFFALSPVTQATEKARFADQRALIGAGSEADTHRAWCESFSDAEWAERSMAGEAWYMRLDPVLQRAYVAAWETHRERHRIPRGPERLRGVGTDIGRKRAS